MSSLLILLSLLAAGETDPDRQCIILVVGAGGTPQFGENFNKWADQWTQLARKADARVVRIGGNGEGTGPDRDVLEKALKAEASGDSREFLWLVLMGHGTFDGKHAKFNLRGPDVTAEELAGWLKPIQHPVAVINCASASGPFINRLSAPNRVVVTATRSGFEYNYSRFGEHMAAAISDPEADLDKDGQTSLLEAFIAASAKVAEFYGQESRLATEHALLDDNGDGLATPANWFRGVRSTRQARDGASLDGLRANQFHLIRSRDDRDMPAEVRAHRDDLERAVEELRQKKGDLDEDEYYDLLEKLLLKLARLYRKLGKN